MIKKVKEEASSYRTTCKEQEEQLQRAEMNRLYYKKKKNHRDDNLKHVDKSEQYWNNIIRSRARKKTFFLGKKGLCV